MDELISKILADIYDLDGLLIRYQVIQAQYHNTQDAQRDIRYIIDPILKALKEIKFAVIGYNFSFEYNEKFGSIKYNINKLMPINDEEIKPRMLDLVEKIEQGINQFPHPETGGKPKTRKGRKSRKSRKSRKYRKSRKSRKVRRY
jgi:hypothetical protein